MGGGRTAFFMNESVERRLGLARAVRSGDLLFVSGTVSIDAKGTVLGKDDMALQLETVYSNLQRILAQSNGTFADVLKETIFTTNMEAFLSHAAIRARRYVDIDPPATTGVEVSRLAHPDLLIEIELIANVPQASTANK